MMCEIDGNISRLFSHAVCLTQTLAGVRVGCPGAAGVTPAVSPSPSWARSRGAEEQRSADAAHAALGRCSSDTAGPPRAISADPETPGPCAQTLGPCTQTPGPCAQTLAFPETADDRR